MRSHPRSDDRGTTRAGRGGGGGASGRREIHDLQTALRDPVYQINPNQPMPDGRTFLEQLVEMKAVDNPYDETVYPVDQIEALCPR
jgi:hypothetical protein